LRTLQARITKALHPAKSGTPVDRTVGDRWLLAAGSCGYIGFLPASGTVSVALVGVPLYWAMSHLGLFAYVAVLTGFTMLSVWVHDRGDRILGEKDSGKLVFDELVGYWIAMTALPFAWPLVLIGFVIERLLDILKVWPAAWVERRIPGGWGVVLDDVVAGLYTCAVLHLLVRWFPGWIGLNPTFSG